MYFQPHEPAEDFRVDTGRLAGCFNSTSATYKFYWLLAVLAEAEKGQEKIDKTALFAQMVAHAWYTVNYFKISFGSADKLERAIARIRELEGLAVDASPAEVHRTLVQSQRKETQRELRHFDTNVPHKFLSQWLGSGAKGTVYELSQHGYNQPPYALYDDHILLQPAWVAYFKRYAGILRGFCYWHLTLFLQVRNPNVPDIPSKLMRPERRGSLSAHKTRFWDLVVEERGGVNCIYTGRRLGVGEYAVEHFIPFQFLAHDQMWNLIPADPGFNSSKRDRLPPMDRYFKGFYDLQREAVNIVKAAQPKNRFLENYLQVFKTHDFDKLAYRRTLEPLLAIADEFDRYVQREKTMALAKICEEEELDRDQFASLMESYIYSKQEPIRDDIFQCLGNRPSVLRAREIGERILGRMREFVEVFVESMVA